VGVGKHHRAPDGGVAETQKMSQFVRQYGFKIGFWIGAQRQRRCEGGIGIAGIEINIGIQNLSRNGGNFACAELLADAVCRYHAGKCQNARREGHI